jgi:hypothetical protein
MDFSLPTLSLLTILDLERRKQLAMAPYVEEPNEPTLTASTKRAPNLVAPEPGTSRLETDLVHTLT